MTADVVPIRRPQPVPLLPAAEPIADVVRLPVQRQRHTRTGPARTGRHGHHADCPYSTQRDAAHCGVCQGIRKGATA